MSVGKSINRVDAYEKVTGRAMYTDDLCPGGALVGKVGDRRFLCRDDRRFAAVVIR